MYEDILSLFKNIGAKISENSRKIYDNKEAGEIVGKGAGGDKTKKIDKVAEDIIIDEISKIYDDFCLISEEVGIKFFRNATKDKCDKFFFVDPIDGSNNATRGIPLFATSLAFSTSQSIDDIKVGYVKNIFGEEYYAVRGKGAYKDAEKHQKISITNTKNIEFLGIEIAPYGKNLDKISKIIQIAKHYRTVGSVALGLCYVASGALDAYIDLRPPRVLDLTAAKLIIEEAGGVCFLDRKISNLDTKVRANLIAGGKDVIENIKEILKI